MVLKPRGAAQTPKRPIFSQIQNPLLLNPHLATAEEKSILTYRKKTGQAPFSWILGVWAAPGHPEPP